MAQVGKVGKTDTVTLRNYIDTVIAVRVVMTHVWEAERQLNTGSQLLVSEVMTS